MHGLIGRSINRHLLDMLPNGLSGCKTEPTETCLARSPGSTWICQTLLWERAAGFK